MKRILSLICVFAMVFACGCSDKSASNEQNFAGTGSYVNGVWLSFSELDAMLSGGNFKGDIEKAVNKCREFGITDLFVHVRSHCDSIFDSEYFPTRSSAASVDFDPLDCIIKLCRQSGIRVHAWINPYRVKTSDSDTETLPQDSPAYKWLHDDNAANDINVCINDGVYLNPASNEVRQLIISGVRELLAKYDVDGIHFDDYFYPTVSEEFDKASYEAYKESCQNPISLADWRRANVNALISGCYTAIKFTDKDIAFSVSPAADIDKVYNSYYADVSAWCKSGCLDAVIPQLYFGYEYPDGDFCFDTLLKRWKSMVKGTDVKLWVGLAAYKLGTENPPDSAEWKNGSTILARQVEDCITDGGVSGNVFFSYTALFSDTNINKTARENIKNCIAEIDAVSGS